MKQTLFTSLILLASIVTGRAESIVENIAVDNFNIEREGNYLSLSMDLDLKDLDVKTNQCVLIEPRIVNGNDSLALQPVAVYGRRRYYYYQRNYNGAIPGAENAISYLAKERPDSVGYHVMMPYSEWMDGAHVALERIDRGCCHKVILNNYGILGNYHDAFFPTLQYIRPSVSREKRFELEGSSYIDFPVDRTEIYPDYRRNPIELDSIRRTIDVVRNNNDATIDTIWLKGFASPESPYSHNTDLAKGRTESLLQYIKRLYSFEKPVVYITGYEPEDWAGLRKAVEGSNLEHRVEILELIDSDMDPDAKEARIKRLYPSEYRFMLQTYYPALRHTDYKVSYVIRSYSDPAEILEVMHTRPQNLDLNEFYIAAEEYEPGTDEFTNVYETAVRMYPDDPVANLNAANAALRKGDIEGAERYISKAGDTPEALYGLAAIAIRKREYDKARTYLRQAVEAGFEPARETLDELNRRTNYKSEK